jgi:tetratricopeptide (TPR) repeat protein
MRTRALGFIVGSLHFAAIGLLSTAAGSQPSAEVQAIGKILSASGAVTVEHKDAVVVQANAPAGGNLEAKVGDKVYRGDVVRTGSNGVVALVFADGTTFNISSNANMELNEFVYDPKGSSNSTLLSLKKGTFTFIAGAVAHTGNMKVETPVGTMGIRGTAPHVEILDDGTVKFTTLIEENKKSLTAKKGQASPRTGGDEPTRSALKDLYTCNGGNNASPTDQIAACTALIDRQIETPQSMALAYNNRGIARTIKGDYELAVQDYDQSIKLYPTFAKAFNNRGLAYEKKGDLDRALSDYTAAINISYDYANAFANRAKIYEKRRDYDRALKDFNEAIRIQPASGNFWNDRCWIRAITSAAQQALADCNEAIRLGPTNAAKFDSRGVTYLKLAQWDLAISDFNSALQLNSQMASSLYGRGLAKSKAGDAAGGNADMAAATRARPGIAGEFAGYGLR